MHMPAQAVCSQADIAELHTCASTFLQLVLIDKEKFRPRPRQHNLVDSSSPATSAYEIPTGASQAVMPFFILDQHGASNNTVMCCVAVSVLLGNDSIDCVMYHRSKSFLKMMYSCTEVNCKQRWV
jgi:hypothetical protein